jgi:uncharacterized membrane protein
MIKFQLASIDSSALVSRTAESIRAYWLWGAVLLIGAVSFFGSPAGYAATSHAVLHGLCAQTPSHTITMGGQMLPFDSRMTGIYGGFLFTLGTLLWRGRFFRFGNPSRPVLAILVGLVALMAADGFNSLLTDLGFWHPWAPSNALRVITGFGCGVSLAVALSWLVASSAWNLGSNEAGISAPRDLIVPVAWLAPFGLVLWAGPGWAHLPITVFLVLSAWITVTLLVLVIVLLTFRIDARILAGKQLHVPVAIAALLAISVMMGLAGARFWAEHWLGISNAMM